MQVRTVVSCYMVRLYRGFFRSRVMTTFDPIRRYFITFEIFGKMEGLTKCILSSPQQLWEGKIKELKSKNKVCFFKIWKKSKWHIY